MIARLSYAAALLSVTALVGICLSTPAQADEVAVAQARVDRLQGLVVETTQKLTDGTRQWEADQARLRQVQLQLSNTRRHIAAAEDVADEGQARLDQLARRMYMSPVPSSTQMWFASAPDTFLGVVQGTEMLNRVAGSDNDIVLRAKTSRHRLRQKEAEVERLTVQARQLVDRSARTQRSLQALAQSTADQLTAAQGALQAARARKEAVEAARVRAARERAAQQRAARSRAAAVGGASCRGKSTAGQQNGNLDPASLCPLWRAPGHRLRADAAAAFDKMSKYHTATVGSPLCVTDSYRSYSEQVDLYRRKPSLAAVPGTSEHGWGKAVDFCGGVQNTGSAAYNWMKANAGRFGWFHPDWAEPSGSKPEPWHWEFSG
ncbi:MAG TPA: D-alanyl-D-alanine carboxypeptidase family protein [Mycobacteriales bacterium]|nr:D-alanyl-D-alanine carboxypeptidase family protein [Mycobacteriales bacterium]